VSRRRRVLLVAALLAGAATLVRSPGSRASGRWGADYFPNVALTTQDGKVVRLYDDLLKGKAVAVNVIYTRCTASCPLETAKLAQVQRLLGDRVGKDIFFYSISIDPAHDTPAALKAYAEKFHAGPGWLFLTGDEDDIKLVSKKLGLSSLTDFANRDGHQPSLMIGNEPTGEWMRNSAVDNPRFLAVTMTNFFGNPKGGVPLVSYSNAPAMPDIGSGGYLFRSRCSACHTIGRGELVGPDLAGVTWRRDRGWLVRYIAGPDRLLAGKDPIAVELFARYRGVRMPDLGLSSGEIAAILRYVEEQAPAAAPIRNAAMP
jgi:protein SCO1